ncbi:amidohydrolase family protein [Rhizosaccharibacter radicis]|uniref:Amidohydrolase family protein n=1 Tax=Rhizosaccharibacter radicis TaxID=2782605 RepID=A0ABT1W039_9PROT|nr:amidohydrolase family protein [Acetobacteraceae bacterium KSS12]
MFRRALPVLSILLAAMAAAAPIATGRAIAAEACRITRGDARLLIRATVLLPDRAVPEGQVLVDAGGRIACVGTECLAQAAGATLLDCPADVLSPGLVNTHDHLAYAAVAPKPDTGERYEHRHEWRKGLDGHRALEDFTPVHDPEIEAWGELRFLVGGTTSTVGGDMAPGLVRNLDFAAGLEGLRLRPVIYRIFPLDDAAGIMRTRDCDYGHHPATRAEVAGSAAFLAHVAEGRDEAARNEFRCESRTDYDRTPQPGGGGTSEDWIVPQATLIHAVALTPADLALVARRGASIVWSPRSNLSLYGRTLDVVEARRLGITVALGSDWLPSGSMNLNRELACALRLDRTRLGGALDMRELWQMVTLDAARAAHADAEIGSIAVGKVADLALFRPANSDPYAAVVEGSPGSTVAVWRGGTLLFGEPAVVDGLRPGCEALEVAGREQRLCREAGRPSAAALMAYARDQRLYPLAFESTPLNEPPCDER